MKKTLALFMAAALLPLAAAAVEHPSQPVALSETRALGVESSIAFPGDATIRNWQADGHDGIWIEGRRGEWFYGRFVGLCRDLNFAQAIGVDTRGVSRLDKFATIIVRGDRCPLTSFVTSAPPPSKRDRQAAETPTGAADEN